MRVLIVDTYYPAFLNAVYASEPALPREPYSVQLRALLANAFGTADFYSGNLTRLGHPAEDIIANCAPLQHQWLREHRGTADVGQDESEAILLAQIRSSAPDVLHIQDCLNISPALVRAARAHAGFITTQIACPYPPDLDFSPYDLVLSSMPHFVELFRSRGIPSQLFRIGFEASLIQRVERAPRRGTVFVGGVSVSHQERIVLLERLAERGLIDWWGYGVEELPEQSSLRRCYRGEAWGLDMYRVLGHCAIALNCHIDVAGSYANNMRLYEATGMGALLLTDAKSNLGDMFEPGTEVVTYSNVDECVEQIVRFTAMENEARRIAGAGQRRTLREHTYAARMGEFVSIVEQHWRP